MRIRVDSTRKFNLIYKYIYKYIIISYEIQLDFRVESSRINSNSYTQHIVDSELRIFSVLTLPSEVILY